MRSFLIGAFMTTNLRRRARLAVTPVTCDEKGKPSLGTTADTDGA